MHLVQSGSFPLSLTIEVADAIDYFEARPGLKGALDAFVVNPPYVRHESLSAPQKSKIEGFMPEVTKGRVDAYFPFLVIGIEALRPGGLGLFVLPQGFLVLEGTKRLRDWIRERAWVRVLADLSGIEVFPGLGVYVVLLVVEKRRDGAPEPLATVVRCRGYAGEALQDVLDGNRLETAYYSIDDVPQADFEKATWSVSRPMDRRIDSRVSLGLTVDDVAMVAQGIVTGADPVFVRPSQSVPPDEAAVYRPFVPDRQIGQFFLPDDSGLALIYPFRGNAMLSADEIAAEFPRTWRYLVEHKQRLEDRAAVRRGHIAWWQLERPRQPDRLFVPKIMGPNLMLVPRFALDRTGLLAVGRTTYITSRYDEPELETLRLLLAVLNSSVAAWHLDKYARKFGSGFSKVEVSVLRRMPIPDWASVSSAERREVLQLVDECI